MRLNQPVTGTANNLHILAEWLQKSVGQFVVCGFGLYAGSCFRKVPESKT